MSGRIKRKQILAALAEAEAAPPPPPTCALCERALGQQVEWHHRIPKSRGGSEVVAVHPICHRAIHAAVTNAELASTYADLPTLRARDDIARFLRWIADKPPDFHAPTRRGRSAD